MIYFSSPKDQYLSHKKDINEAIAKVLDSGWYILGNEVKCFEREFAAYIGVSHAFGVGSGTEALHIALKACNIGPGDEVITVSHTAVATVSAITLCGASPVFVDIEPDYFAMDTEKLEALISPRTKAVIPVHIYGQPANMAKVISVAQKHNIFVIEDCAQAHGAEYKNRKAGSFGDISCYSFYPTKNLGAVGDGGAVLTNNEELATRVKLLREYGWAERYISYIDGWNSRLDEIQAAILRIKLNFLDDDNGKRRKIAGIYAGLQSCTNITLPEVRPDANHVYHLYVIKLQERDKLLNYLKDHGIGTLIHYPVPVHLQRAYLMKFRGSDNLPVTERTAKEILSLPIYPELEDEQVEKVVEVIKQYYV